MMSTKRKWLAATLCVFMAVATIGSAGGGPETGEGGGGAGEEGGSALGLDETFDQVRKGARLIMSYDTGASAFIGTVENTTNATLQQVRVEVHLSNGTELGPTTPQDLAAGKSMAVRLDAAGESFTGWTPHAEVGPQSSGGGEGSEGSEGSGGEGGSFRLRMRPMHDNPFRSHLQQYPRPRAFRDPHACRSQHGDDIQPSNATRCRFLAHLFQRALMLRSHPSIGGWYQQWRH